MPGSVVKATSSSTSSHSPSRPSAIAASRAAARLAGEDLGRAQPVESVAIIGIHAHGGQRVASRSDVAVTAVSSVAVRRGKDDAALSDRAVDIDR